MLHHRFPPRPFVATFLLLTLIALGIFVRLWNFGSLPLSLNRDEASIAYNAWTIAHEGVDEWGTRFPLMFRAFGDYKLPGYIYSLSGLLLLLEPEPWVVRLPSLLAGMCSLVLVGWLARQLWPELRQGALAAAALLAVTPWAIYYSRTAFEAHLAVCLTLFALNFLLLGRTRLWAWVIAPLFLFLAGITYNTPFLLTPVIVGGFVLIHWKLSLQRRFATALLVGLSLCAAAFTLAVQYSAFMAKSDTSVFYDPTHAAEYRELRASSSGILEVAWNHKFSYFTRVVALQYLQTVGPQFLLTGGGHPWHSVAGQGHFLGVQYLLSIAGILLILRKQPTASEWWLLLLIFAAPLPSAITVDAPHATRSLVFFSLTALPASYALGTLRKKPQVFAIVVALLLLEFYRYAWVYHTQFSSLHQPLWKVGLLEAVQTAEETHPAVPVAIQGTNWSEYIYVVLGARVPAAEFQKTVVYDEPDSVGYSQVKQVGRYQLLAPSDVPDSRTLRIEPNAQGFYQLHETAGFTGVQE